MQDLYDFKDKAQRSKFERNAKTFLLKRSVDSEGNVLSQQVQALNTRQPERVQYYLKQAFNSKYIRSFNDRCAHYKGELEFFKYKDVYLVPKYFTWEDTVPAADYLILNAVEKPLRIYMNDDGNYLDTNPFTAYVFPPNSRYKLIATQYLLFEQCMVRDYLEYQTPLNVRVVGQGRVVEAPLVARTEAISPASSIRSSLGRTECPVLQPAAVDPFQEILNEILPPDPLQTIVRELSIGSVEQILMDAAEPTARISEPNFETFFDDAQFFETNVQTTPVEDAPTIPRGVQASPRDVQTSPRVTQPTPRVTGTDSQTSPRVIQPTPSATGTDIQTFPRNIQTSPRNIQTFPRNIQTFPRDSRTDAQTFENCDTTSRDTRTCEIFCDTGMTNPRTDTLLRTVTPVQTCDMATQTIPMQTCIPYTSLPALPSGQGNNFTFINCTIVTSGLADLPLQFDTSMFD